MVLDFIYLHIFLQLHDDLIASMEYYWPSLIKVKNRNNKPFWSHEWSAHGSCTSFTQAEYFGKVVSIAAELPLASKLYSAGLHFYYYCQVLLMLKNNGLHFCYDVELC